MHSRGRICPSHKELCKKRPSSGIAEIEKRHERLYREECCSVAKSFPALQPPGLWPVRLLWPWRFPGLSTGAGCPFFLQRTFLTQGSNLSLGALPLHPRGSPAGRNTSFGCDSNFADLKWVFNYRTGNKNWISLELIVQKAYIMQTKVIEFGNGQKRI